MSGAAHGWRLELGWVARAVGGRLEGPAGLRCRAVATDSRRLEGGELFVALRGPRHDGHAFLAEAARRGAAAALAERPAPGLPTVVVADTLAALGRLAAAWREALAGPLVAVTGSWGKTTVKELLGAVLGRRAPVLASPGNLNNAVGLPLSLLGLGPEHRAAVVELGASAPGEVAALAALARPRVGVLTGAGAAHLEGFGSLEGVARAKGELLEGLGPEGIAVYPADAPATPLWEALAEGRRRLRFGLEAGEVRAAPGSVRVSLEGEAPGTSFVLRAPQGEVPVRLRLLGLHQVRNALAAAAAALALAEAGPEGMGPVPELGLDLEEVAAGLEAARPVPGRLQALAGPGGALILDDSYNANPEALAAALAVLGRWPGERHLVLGDMLELGPEAPARHREAGRLAREAGVARLHALGPLAAEAAAAFGRGGRAYPDLDSLLGELGPALGPGRAVLVKGSRGARMERVVEALLAAGEG